MPVLSGMTHKDGGFMDGKAHWLQSTLVSESIDRREVWSCVLYKYMRRKSQINATRAQIGNHEMKLKVMESYITHKYTHMYVYTSTYLSVSKKGKQIDCSRVGRKDTVSFQS